MFETIGPHMWAVFACIGFMFVGSFLVTHGLVGAIVGIPVLAAATGALVDIVFYDGTTFPGIGLPIGVVAGLIVLALSGASVVLNSRGSAGGSRSNLRDRIPHFETKQVVATVVGSVFVLVAAVALLGQLDLKTNNTTEGFAIATDELDRQSTATMRRIERFLAR